MRRWAGECRGQGGAPGVGVEAAAAAAPAARLPAAVPVVRAAQRQTGRPVLGPAAKVEPPDRLGADELSRRRRPQILRRRRQRPSLLW